MFAATTPYYGNSFAPLLRECRKRAGLSQQQLADYIAVSPKRVSKWETGVIKPPQDPEFYDRLRAVPGFSDTDIMLLREAAQTNKSSEDIGKLLDQLNQLEANRQSIRKILESGLRSLQSGSSIEVQQRGLADKNRQDPARIEAAKENRDRALLLAHQLKELGRFTASGKQYVLDLAEHLTTIDAELPEVLQAYGALLSQAFVEALTMYAELPLRALVQPSTQAPQALTIPAEVEEEVQEYSAKSLPDIGYRGIIPSPMPPKEVVPGDHIIDIVTELQSQARLGSEKERPTHYPHENVVFHVARLRAEDLRQEEPPSGSGIIYERGRLATIAEAARVSGVKMGTLRNYLSDRKLTERGRITAPGGGKVLIDLDQLDSVLSSRKLGGRPRKTPKRLLDKRPRGRPRKT
jgi:transcriptional regulator with XRE-family HTH domain